MNPETITAKELSEILEIPVEDILVRAEMEEWPYVEVDEDGNILEGD